MSNANALARRTPTTVPDGSLVAAYGSPDWRVPSLRTRVLLQELGEASPALHHAHADGDSQLRAKLEHAKPAQEHRMLAELPSPLSPAPGSDDGPQVLLLARDEDGDRRLVQKVA